MRTTVGILTAACLVLAACSSSNPEPPAAKVETAPSLFQVNFDTSKGKIVVEIHRDWAPIGVDHFYSLVKRGFYDGDRFFRVIRGFIVQFGLSGDPALNRQWADAKMPDDPPTQHNLPAPWCMLPPGPAPAPRSCSST